MDNPDLQNWLIGGMAVIVAISAFLMMFTTVFTTKKPK